MIVRDFHISAFLASSFGFAVAISLAGCGGGAAPAPWQGLPAAKPAAHVQPANVKPAYRVIYSFQGYPVDGRQPLSSLSISKGLLYGTTGYGGSTDNGTVFAISPGSGQETQLYSFAGAGNGADPKAGVSIVDGVIYGTTTGSKSSNGTVYDIVSGEPNTLYPFQGSGDGAVPTAGLTYVTTDSADVFYGTTSSGGAYGHGTVFDVSVSGAENIIYNFKGQSYGDGAGPVSGLQNVNGTLYGTTLYGGKYNKGTLYSVSLSGYEQVIHSFGSSSHDGQFPESGVTSGFGTTLFGTTDNGGKYGKGTVYEYSSNKLKIIYSFRGNPDGAFPLANLLYRQGVLYGTTSGGGKHSEGTVYKIVLASGGESVLHNFPSYSGDGKGPVRRLSYENGMLYGTTKSGGSQMCPGTGGCGTVFVISP